ncbi:MAG: hypothetical protein JXR59_01495 [Desulfuromonadaceae bacterium]|nr:hypothetical protein [Desulfuromonadaceae bacterium]
MIDYSDDVVRESVCQRCGRCCYEKIVDRGVIYYTNIPCPYLDAKTRLCTIYERRQQVRPDCAVISRAIVEMGVLPADCPYVCQEPGYVAPQPAARLPRRWRRLNKRSFRWRTTQQAD